VAGSIFFIQRHNNRKPGGKGKKREREGRGRAAGPRAWDSCSWKKGQSRGKPTKGKGGGGGGPPPRGPKGQTPPPPGKKKNGSPPIKMKGKRGGLNLRRKEKEKKEEEGKERDPNCPLNILILGGRAGYIRSTEGFRKKKRGERESTVTPDSRTVQSPLYLNTLGGGVGTVKKGRKKGKGRKGTQFSPGPPPPRPWSKKTNNRAGT